MNDKAEALVLEDDPEELTELSKILETAGFAAVRTRSPSEAIRMLDPTYHQPVLAIVDMNMSKAPDRSQKSDDVLMYLYKHHPSCTVLVHSANINTVESRLRIQTLHPKALLHDKGGNTNALMTRIPKLGNARVGDLVLDGGRVLHEPSGKVATHRIAVSLMMAYHGDKKGISVITEANSRALRRFKNWLTEINSTVHVIRLSDFLYRLEIQNQVQ
jgi:CheY-like chemotaxis protein